MLVQFALLVFALSGLLALVVDIGYARVSQHQMQNAADMAAIEGLRKRDVGVRNGAGVVVNDAFASDCLRRASASRVVGWSFDDDFDRAGGDAGFQFGAGPVIDMTDGVTTVHALQTIDYEGLHVYKPDLQLNQDNEVDGDMVSGRFCYNADPAASEGITHASQDVVCTEPQRGTSAFARNDFNPSATSPAPPIGLRECPAVDEDIPNPWPLPGSGSLSGVDNSAFLVRLRRSNDFGSSGLESGIGSSGPPLPLTFGKGTTIHGDDPSSTYSVRRDGFEVRATAIAAIRPAMHVGRSQANPAQLGVVPFALVDTYVAALPATAVQATLNPATGAICAGLICAAATPAIGRFIDNLTDQTRVRWLLVSTVGQPLPASTPLACALTATRTGYGPVYSLMASLTNRVIGFTRITLSPDPARIANPCAKVVLRGPSAVVSNASATLHGALVLPISATRADIRELIDKNRARNGRVNYAPVLAPILAR